MRTSRFVADSTLEEGSYRMTTRRLGSYRRDAALITGLANSIPA